MSPRCRPAGRAADLRHSAERRHQRDRFAPRLYRMIEFTRFLLSTIVLEAHIWPLGVPWLAWQSVFAFYTLSGFLMTRVLHERYGFGLNGLLRFALNRVLRL